MWEEILGTQAGALLMADVRLMCTILYLEMSKSLQTLPNYVRVFLKYKGLHVHNLQGYKIETIKNCLSSDTHQLTCG